MKLRVVIQGESGVHVVNRNYISNDKYRVCINNLEMNCHRVYFNPFDLLVFYSYCLKQRLVWTVNVVFGLDYLYVNSEECSMHTFREMVNGCGIMVYTENEVVRFERLKQDGMYE